MNLPSDVVKDFPKLANSSARKTSEESERYNCAAYVLGDKKKPWWPDDGRRYWPNNSPDTINNFVDVFREHGFEICEHGNFEANVEKLALYVKDGIAKHVAIQLPSRRGLWRSKLGNGIDVEHEIEDLEGELYGRAEMFFGRHKGRARGSKRP